MIHHVWEFRNEGKKSSDCHHFHTKSEAISKSKSKIKQKNNSIIRIQSYFKRKIKLTIYQNLKKSMNLQLY